MTTSERIRAAALGPAPVWPSWPSSWFDGEHQPDVYRWARADDWFWRLDHSKQYNDLRRMFLLFVAEAVK